MLNQIVRDQLRLLAFRPTSGAIVTRWKSYLAFGLVCSWLAGVGRYWDNPRAEWWQVAGLGSVVYVFTLSAFLWILLAPLKPSNWSIRNVIVFVALTSLPAIVYAVPVERFLARDGAALANVLFLALVATWRVALLIVFLRRVAKLAWVPLAVATLLPLSLIIVVLAALNLEHVAFDLMAGIRAEERTANDTAYNVVWGLSIYSIVSAPFLIVAYAVCIVVARWPSERSKQL